MGFYVVQDHSGKTHLVEAGSKDHAFTLVGGAETVRIAQNIDFKRHEHNEPDVKVFKSR